MSNDERPEYDPNYDDGIDLGAPGEGGRPPSDGDFPICEPPYLDGGLREAFDTNARQAFEAGYRTALDQMRQTDERLLDLIALACAPAAMLDEQARAIFAEQRHLREDGAEQAWSLYQIERATP